MSQVEINADRRHVIVPHDGTDLARTAAIALWLWRQTETPAPPDPPPGPGTGFRPERATSTVQPSAMRRAPAQTR